MKLPFLYIILVTSLLMVNTVHAEKNVTMTLEKNDMVWCYYGSKDKPTAICNSMELQGKSELMDGFLYFMEYGPVIDCD